MESLRRVVPFVLVCAMAAPAAADVSGNFRGVMVGTASLCPVPTPIGGAFTLRLSQSGTQVTGSLTFEQRTNDCRVIEPGKPPQVVSIPVTGTASGPTFRLTFEAGPGLTASVNGAVAGDLISFSFSAGDTTGEGIGSREGTAPAKFGGTWRGTGEAVATFCTPPVGSSFPLTIAITQSGSQLSGTATMLVGLRDCREAPLRTLESGFTATADGHSFSSSFAVGDPVGSVFFTAGMIELDVSDPADDVLLVSFHAGDTTGRARLSRVAGSSTPAILSFTAQPSVVVRGGSAVLSWTTANAASVSIDQGVGTQPPTGSVTVTPAQTTTYTLVATAAGGAVATASATVTVTSGSGRRRSTRRSSADPVGSVVDW